MMAWDGSTLAAGLKQGPRAFDAVTGEVRARQLIQSYSDVNLYSLTRASR